MNRNNIGKSITGFGCLMLSITAFLHLYLGLPPIISGIDNEFIKKAPSISPEELFGIWIAFSVMIFFVIIIAIYNLMKKNPDRITIILAGMVSVSSGLTMYFSNPGIHISVPLLCFPGLLIVLGALILKKE